jgi:hypothetical protein
VKITLTFKQVKGGYAQFTAPEVRGVVYFSAAAFTGTPGNMQVEVAGLAAPVAARTTDPAKLAAQAAKTQAQLDKLTARSKALAAQLATANGTKLVKGKKRAAKPAPVAAPVADAAAADGAAAAAADGAAAE